MINAEKAASFQTIVSGSTVGTLQVPVGVRMGRATLSLETAQIRYRYEGGDPTATEGHIMEPGDSFTLEGPDNIANFRHIRTGATSGVLSVTLENAL